MIRFRVSILFLVTAIALLGAAQAGAITIDDNYIGDITGGDDGHGADVYDPETQSDSESIYDVTKMDATFDSGTLEVTIYSNFFSDWQDGYNPYDPGDLFISTNGWHPYGNAADGYLEDNATTGEQWEYVVDLTGLANLPSSSAANVYATSAGTVNNGEERINQEASFTPDDNATVLIEGRWLINADSLVITLPDISLLSNFDFDNLGFHWTMTCGNDVIEGGTSPVPEPATMLLFGTGLAGLAGLRRRSH